MDVDALSPDEPGELPITPALLAAFRATLDEQKIRLRFFSGAWDSFDVSAAGGRYELVLTSETIYQITALPALVKLLHDVSVGVGGDSREAGDEGGGADDEASLAELARSKLDLGQDRSCVCLVAAKVLYFGVGGGVPDFVNTVSSGVCGSSGEENPAIGTVQVVMERKAGVGRQIMRVSWNH
jgi:protein-histidine N-methyltransferase